MDEKVQHSIHYVSLNFLCVSILFNVTFYMCIKHKEWELAKELSIMKNSLCAFQLQEVFKKIRLYFNFVGIYKGNF